MADEFREWCQKVALEWDYDVQISSVGRAIEVDEWGRDEELGGATSVAVFRRLHSEGREAKAREVYNGLQRHGEPHKLLATHIHLAHPDAEKPKPLNEIGLAVKKKMEEFREAFMRVEEIWFEQDIAILCGGWIEMLVRAVEESEFLILKRDGEDMKKDRGAWAIELVGGVANPKELWPGETSLDHIPRDWIPEEDIESSEGGWDGSTDMEGDVSWNENDDEDEDLQEPVPWGSSRSSWGETSPDIKGAGAWGFLEQRSTGWNEADLARRVPPSSASSITGWDGDKSDDTT